jgi:intracellular sulfur oxidation DsrE/DsrF family protein
MVIDAPTINGLGEALLFANNYITANRTGYNVQASDLAIVIVIRHLSTAFAFTDAMWEKYGASMDATFQDPKTKAAAKINVFNASGYGTSIPNFGITLDAVAKQGVHFAICAMATSRIAGQVATATKSEAAAITKELTSNLIPNGRMVPAGIVAVTRAQERGYAVVRA